MQGEVWLKRNMDIEWDYSEDKGSKNWVSLCDWFARGAEFPLQSPTRLTKGEETKVEGDILSSHYRRQQFTDKEFKNTIHLVSFGQLNYAEFKKKCYCLTDIRFHLPSEHIINGEQEDIELHLAHMNSKKGNLVMGVMYQLMVQEGWLYNQESGESWNLEKHEHWVNLNVFSPEQKSHFHYIGPLTAPSTSGPIQWFIADYVEKLDQESLLSFDGQYTQPNNRPIQPLNGREIYRFEEFEQ